MTSLGCRLYGSFSKPSTGRRRPAFHRILAVLEPLRSCSVSRPRENQAKIFRCPLAIPLCFSGSARPAVSQAKAAPPGGCRQHTPPAAGSMPPASRGRGLPASGQISPHREKEKDSTWVPQNDFLSVSESTVSRGNLKKRTLRFKARQVPKAKVHAT